MKASALLLLAAVATSPAAAADVVAVVDAQKGPYADVLRGLGGPPVIEAHGKDVVTKIRSLAPATQVMVLGEAALAATRKAVPPARYCVGLVRATALREGECAIQLEPTLEMQLDWIARAFPGRNRVLLLRSQVEPRHAELARQAEARGLRLVFVDVTGGGDAVRALQAEVTTEREKTVVWLRPDDKAVNASTVGPLCKRALAARVVAVGFSSYFLKAGAVAAVQQDFERTGQQLLRQAHGPRGQAVPQHTGLEVNGRLAGRLGVSVQDGAGVVVRR